MYEKIKIIKICALSLVAPYRLETLPTLKKVRENFLH